MEKLTASEIQSLKNADQEHYFHPTSSIKTLEEKGVKIMVKGKGCKLWNVEGKEFIDGTAGLWLSAIGHGREEIAEVAKEQIKTLEYWHSFNEFGHPSAIRLAEKVAGMVPVKNAKVFFTCDGSEGNDTIIKLVRFYWYAKGVDSKDFIITRDKAYHGVNCGAVCATRLPGFHEGFGPHLPGFDVIGAPFCYDCSWGQDYPECSLECAEALEKKINQLGQDKVAAFIAEPIVGTGGAFSPPAGYYEKIREICDKYDVLFIADEVINAFGRTGKWFGIEHWPGVKPDIMNMAKGITSGYIPLGAVAISDEIFQTLKTKDRILHGYTYSGHPVACAVALKNLEIIEAENLVENARRMGERLVRALRASDVKGIGDVRGTGLLIGIDLVKHTSPKEKFSTPLGNRVVEIAYDRGLLIRCLVNDIIQLSPPMVVSEEEVDTIVKILIDSITKAYEEVQA